MGTQTETEKVKKSKKSTKLSKAGQNNNGVMDDFGSTWVVILHASEGG